MQYNYLDFLSKVSNKVAPSGYEDDVVRIWKECIFPYVDDVMVDVMGNVIAVKKGTSGKKLMLAAHADEVGLIITHVDSSGFLYFDGIGGIDVDILLGRSVIIKGMSRDVYGVIGVKPIHLKPRDAKTGDISYEDLWIDIGANSKDDALEKVSVGCVATIFSEMHVYNKRVSGKAMDNRCSLAVLIELARRLSDYKSKDDIYFVATAQEELRARGAQSVAYNINPDACVVLDVAHATDYPSMSPIRDGDVKLGAGAVITLGPNFNRKIVQELRTIAEGYKLKYQIEVASRPTGTDANPIQVTKTGIPTALVGIPCRYMHSPIEMIDCEDMDAVASLLEKFLESFDISCLTN